jgi:hypothetical protein
MPSLAFDDLGEEEEPGHPVVGFKVLPLIQDRVGEPGEGMGGPCHGSADAVPLGLVEAEHGVG